MLFSLVVFKLSVLKTSRDGPPLLRSCYVFRGAHVPYPIIRRGPVANRFGTLRDTNNKAIVHSKLLIQNINIKTSGPGHFSCIMKQKGGTCIRIVQY